MPECNMPIMRSVLAIKRELPHGMILLMKIGEYYEAFGEDALVASDIFGKPLSHRNDVPMCGLPADRINAMLAKMVRVGKSVALAERAEKYRWEVTRIIRP